MNCFVEAPSKNGLDATTTPITSLPENALSWLLVELNEKTIGTEKVVVAAVMSFFQFVAAEELATVNLERLRLLRRQRGRRNGHRLPTFPKDDLEAVLAYVQTLKPESELNGLYGVHERLRALRDKALLLTLADSGLRIHEACNLLVGDIDFRNKRAVIIGKGDKEAVVRFSDRAIQTIREYLEARRVLDKGKRDSLPVFARHDKGTGYKVQPITTMTGQNIVNDRVREALGPDAVGTISPHKFRHLFVTSIIEKTGNIVLAQRLARHENIATTQRYAHLSAKDLDMGYETVFERG